MIVISSLLAHEILKYSLSFGVDTLLEDAAHLSGVVIDRPIERVALKLLQSGDGDFDFFDKLVWPAVTRISRDVQVRECLELTEVLDVFEVRYLVVIHPQLV